MCQNEEGIIYVGSACQFLFHRDIHPRGVGPTTAGVNFEYQC